MKKPLLIDTHAHINFNGYKDDGGKIINRALEHGVWVINVGAQYSSSVRAVKYANKYEQGVYAIVGLHPSHVISNENPDSEDVGKREFEEFNQGKYRKLLEDKKTVALGEIGLDYYDKITDQEKEKQQQAFLEQLELAQQMNKPVAIHCRKAYEDLIGLLTMFNSGCASCPHACAPAGLKGVVHCFVGRWAQAEKLLAMDFYLSFTGLITYVHDYDKVIEKAPLENILIETDSPYLAPEPHRGKRNEPLYVKYVAQRIAQIKKIKFAKVAEQTTKNAKELFGI
ncbi:MAG: hydrolase TatD [Parcubacteria group bacterium]|jgi:TatD DNase family protein|nr:hydrolase TatD [Parcubacteria group bacterium]|tara:strand:+ start:727 stop:1575 length:849 start_codon:yes stop_codon:yes gene_type:complete